MYMPLLASVIQRCVYFVPLVNHTGRHLHLHGVNVSRLWSPGTYWPLRGDPSGRNWPLHRD